MVQSIMLGRQPVRQMVDLRVVEAPASGAGGGAAGGILAFQGVRFVAQLLGGLVLKGLTTSSQSVSQ